MSGFDLSPGEIRCYPKTCVQRWIYHAPIHVGNSGTHDNNDNLETTKRTYCWSLSTLFLRFCTIVVNTYQFLDLLSDLCATWGHTIGPKTQFCVIPWKINGIFFSFESERRRIINQREKKTICWCHLLQDTKLFWILVLLM